MRENISTKAIVNNASICGFILGAVSVAYAILTQFLSGMDSGILLSMITIVLWLAKFTGCIYILRFFMKKLTAEYSNVENSHTLKQGLLSAGFSALLVSAYTFADLAYIRPEMLSEQVDLIYQMYSNMLDSNSMQALEEILPKMPMISFFSNLIYCFLYGTVLSVILSKNIPSRDPFADTKSESDDIQ